MGTLSFLVLSESERNSEVRKEKSLVVLLSLCLHMLSSALQIVVNQTCSISSEMVGRTNWPFR